MVPLARVGRAIQTAGHEVMLLAPPALAPSAQRTGLPFRLGEEPARAFVTEIWQRVRAGPVDAVSGLIDRELFADRCTAAMLGTVREVRETWQPDLVVREPCEYASAVAAHEAGIAQAQVAISLASVESKVHAMVAPIIERFAPGVAAAIASSPYLSSFPPSVDPSPWPDTRRFRVSVPLPPPDGPERRSSGDPPLVYVTFGTVLSHLPEAIGVFRCALDAVAELPVRVLLTVGQATDVGHLGQVPENTRVEPWVTQDEVLRHADVVVCHGGSGTTFGALAAGLPLVVCPLFADQWRNAGLVRDAGAGLVVGGDQPPPGGLRGLGPEDAGPLRAAIEEVLGEPGYRRAAQQVASEIADLPALDEVVRELV